MKNVELSFSLSGLKKVLISATALALGISVLGTSTLKANTNNPNEKVQVATRLGTGDLGTGDLGTGDLGTGDLGTGDLGTGDLGTGDLGTGDLGTGDLGTGDLGTGDLGTGDLSSGDLKPDANVVQTITKKDVNKNTGVVEITSNESTVKLSAQAVKDTKKLDAKGLSVSLKDGVVDYDSKALAVIQKEAKDAKFVSIKLSEVKDLETLANKKQQAAIINNKGLAVYDITLTVTDKNDKDVLIHNFNGGKATITVSFKDAKNSDLLVKRVEENGKLVAMPTTYKNGVLTWETDGHSYYVIIRCEKEDSTDNQADNQTNNQSNGNSVDNEIPHTADSSMLYIWSSLMIAGLVAMKASRKLAK